MTRIDRIWERFYEYCVNVLQMMFVEGCKSTTSLFEPIPVGQVAPPVRALPLEDVCGILFSSGTGGLPKAVEMTHKTFLSNCFLSE